MRSIFAGMKRIRSFPFLFLLTGLFRCTTPPDIHIQRQLDSLDRTLNHCAQYYVIDENTLHTRVAQSRQWLATLDSLPLDGVWQSRVMQYRGIIALYREFLNRYNADEWDFHQLQKQAAVLRKAWQMGEIPPDSMESRLRSLRRKVTRHCEQTRQWVRRVVDVEPIYERIAPQLEKRIEQSSRQTP